MQYSLPCLVVLAPWFAVPPLRSGFWFKRVPACGNSNHDRRNTYAHTSGFVRYSYTYQPVG